MDKSLILVGPQGSGKGTQAKILAEEFGLVIFDTGANLRRISKENSELGKQIKKITTKGDLVPTKVVIEVVRDFIQTNKGKNFIFDGMPRSAEQKELFDQMLQEESIEIIVLSLQIPREKSIERLLKRAEIEGRADDTPEGIAKRLEVFDTSTKPLLEGWKSDGILIEIDGSNTPDKVHEEILGKLS